MSNGKILNDKRIRLVMIQGDAAALYEGREQLCVFDGASDTDEQTIARVRMLTRKQAEEHKKAGQHEAAQS